MSISFNSNSPNDPSSCDEPGVGEAFASACEQTATLDWDGLARRFELELSNDGLSDWIDADLRTMETELSRFTTPIALKHRRR